MNIPGRSFCALLAGTVLAIALAACKGPQQESAPAPAGETPSAASITDTGAIKAALDKPDRLAGDSDEDAWRKADEVLAFLDVKPGSTVVDYFSAAGYYTELLAHLVGPQGQVIAYNNAPYLAYAGKRPLERYAGNRLANVSQLTTTPEEIPLEAASVDAILFVNAYHDLYWRPQNAAEWPPVDPKAALAKLLPALKPGGTVVVVDHIANAGGDTAKIVDTLHRIDPAVVKQDFTAAGLTFEAESAALKNPQDDHAKAVTDPAIRHKTDQFIYKFRKPAA
jgi:predicted methyltransferase